MSEVSQPGEQESLVTLFRELEDILNKGFYGKISLHCRAGRVARYTIEEDRIPGSPIDRECA